ncbi:MAG: zinc-binding dehydrogenase [Pikeienuella sp.]
MIDMIALKKSMAVLVHAAADGVGRLLCQRSSQLGITVLGTVGSSEKAASAKASGCGHSILYRETALEEEVMKLAEWPSVDVVVDTIGVDTFCGIIGGVG